MEDYVFVHGKRIRPKSYWRVAWKQGLAEFEKRKEAVAYMENKMLEGILCSINRVH